MEGYENVLSVLEFNIVKGLLFRQRSGGSTQREKVSPSEGPGRQWDLLLVSPLTALLLYKAEIL